MVLLYLDDVRAPPSEEWVVVRNIEEAKRFMLANAVDFASLDHDMGECAECEASFPQRGYRLISETCRHLGNGYEFVIWMAEHNCWPKQKPVVHSANAAGRQAMEQAIERYYVAPKT